MRKNTGNRRNHQAVEVGLCAICEDADASGIGYAQAPRGLMRNPEDAKASGIGTAQAPRGLNPFASAYLILKQSRIRAGIAR